MTDDIVQRLRAGNHRLCVGARLDPLRVDRPCDPCSESLDAADEIERLRAELSALRRHTNYCPYMDSEWWCMCAGPGHDEDCVYTEDDPPEDDA